MRLFSLLPTLNAILNLTSALLLGAGFIFIRRHRVRIHRRIMLTALAVSLLFLVSYLVYHANVGSVHFRGEGWVRPFYFSLLTSHTLCAIAVVPLALVTLSRALRRRFAFHRRIARWTLPIWMYVSVTGVLVYLMLYVLYPSPIPL